MVAATVDIGAAGTVTFTPTVTPAGQPAPHPAGDPDDMPDECQRQLHPRSAAASFFSISEPQSDLDLQRLRPGPRDVDSL